MKKATRGYLAKVAKDMALVPFHGAVDGLASNLAPIVRAFPAWNVREADGLWCAAFVYYCCREAGFEIPYRPDECKTCHLAGCLGWEEFAVSDQRIEYHKGAEGFVPEAGDIVLYDSVFENKEHDHIGIVLEKREYTLLAAEGNINNVSGIIERPIDGHIRAYIRIPDGYRYRAESSVIVIKPLETEAEIKGKAFVHWQAWKETYTGLIDQAFLDSRTLEMSERIALRAFQNGYQTVIAEDGDRVIGFADYGAYRGDDLKDAGEVYAIYILKAYYGQGVGCALMRKALEELKQYRQVSVWVLEGNARAIRFYTRCGFRFDGQTQELALGTPVTEARMILKAGEGIKA